MAGSIRDRLTSAAAQLKEAARQDLEASRPDAAAAKQDAAAAVEAVLAPRGYLLLREARKSSSSLTLTLSKEMKQALLAAGEEFGVVFSGLAEEAYRRVRNERWIPGEAPRAKQRRGGAERAVLNVSVDDDLRQEVRAMLPDLSREAGYRVTEANVVLTHIFDELGIERPGANAESFQLRYPKVLVAHWMRQAEGMGLTLEQIVEERLPAVLDGSWTPGPHPYVADVKSRKRVTDESRPGITVWAPSSGGRWSEAERQTLWLRLDRDLMNDLRDKAEELSEQSGVLVYPGGIIRAILADRLGEPAE